NAAAASRMREVSRSAAAPAPSATSADPPACGIVNVEAGSPVNPAILSCLRSKPSDFGGAPVVKTATPIAVALVGGVRATEMPAGAVGSRKGGCRVRLKVSVVVDTICAPLARRCVLPLERRGPLLDLGPMWKRRPSTQHPSTALQSLPVAQSPIVRTRD